MSDIPFGESADAAVASALVALLECSGDPIFSVDSSYRYTSFNTSHAKVMKALYGVDIEQGKSVLGYQTVTDDRRTAKANLDRALRGEHVVESAFSGENALTRRYFEVAHDPVVRGEAILGVLVRAIDVTERRRAEAQLRESEDKFKYVFDYSPLGKSITLPSGEIHVNRAFSRMVGYSQEELEHTRWQDITPPEDIELTQKEIDPVLSGERDEVRFVKRYRHKDGSLVWADVSTSLRRGEAGEPLYFVTAISDITAQRAAQDGVRASEARYRDLVAHMSSGLVVYEPTAEDADFVIRQFNVASERIEGLNRDAVIGKLVTEAFPGVEEFGLLDVLRRVARTGVPERYPTAHYHDEHISSWRENYIYRLPSREVVAVYDDVTERVRAEQAEARARELLERAEEIGHAGGWEYDVAADKVTWTDEVYRIHGVELDFDPNDAGRDIDFYAPSSAPSIEAAFRHAIEAGESYDLEAEIDRADGVRVWVRTIGRPVMENGVVTRVSGNITDITERKRAEESLSASEARYRIMGEAVDYGVWATDAEGAAIHISQSFCDLVGKSFDEIREFGWLDMLVPEQREDVDRRWLHSVATGEPFEHEHHFVTKSGEVRVVLARGNPVRNEDGLIVGWAGINLDITENKKAEYALRDNRALLQAIIDGTEDAIYAKDVKGRYLVFNAGAERVTGRRAEEVLGKDDTFLFPPDEAQMVMNGDRTVMDSAAPATYEETVTNVEGVLSTFLSTKGPLHDERGDLRGLFGIARDITERKLAENQIRRLNADLERRVLERTSQLDAANKELEAFAYSVSHDLRAPLRHISGFASILVEDSGDSLDEEGRSCLDTISASVREMGVLIDDLLQFSRVGRAEMQIRDVDMDLALSEALRPIQDDNAARAIEWSIGPLPPVVGDHALLRQVWANLLDNAVKYSRGRSPARIEIGARDGDGASEAVFFVRDNGVGFDMAYVHKLFGVFQRLHSSAEFEGTGIGLANVRRIVTRLGGRA